jgi:excisionase family DNA binding protein
MRKRLYATVSSDTPKATLSVYEAADLAGVCRNGMYRAVRRGEIPSLRVGGRILIPRAALEKMLNGETNA